MSNHGKSTNNHTILKLVVKMAAAIIPFLIALAAVYIVAV